MKKIILLLQMVLLFIGGLYAQNATINDSIGNSNQYVCENSTIDLSAGITVGTIDSVQWITRVSTGGGTYSGWSLVSYADTIVVPSGGAVDGNLYQYKLTVYQSGSGYVAVVTLHVNSSPSVTLMSSTNEICAGENVVFTASSGNANYDFQVNGISVQSGVLEDYSSTILNDGDVVTVVVTNANGCEATSAGITMIVHALPIITDIVYSSAYSLATEECPGTLVDVTLTMSGTSPFTVKVYDIVGGNPTGILFTESGLTGPVDVFSKPVDGGDVYYTIEDFYCPSVVITP